MQSFSLKKPGGRRYSSGWIREKLNQKLNCFAYRHLSDLSANLDSQDFALQIGGDHYTLDYGKPLAFMAMDRYLKKRGVPVFLWGVSVGPFEKNQSFKRTVMKHLEGLDGIFVREITSYHYLIENGLSNVYLICDPAFLMKAKVPNHTMQFEIADNMIGINLSPMLAFYRGLEAKDVSIEAWIEECVLLVKAMEKFDRPLLLIPHVESDNIGNDDRFLLEQVQEKVLPNISVPIFITPKGLNAQEIKWVISCCKVFVGGRTHSTIAALSSEVPTLSIAYSRKALGINQDVFGHQKYCVPVEELTTAKLIEKISLLIDDEKEIRIMLKARLPDIRARADLAGKTLQRIVYEKR